MGKRGCSHSMHVHSLYIITVVDVIHIRHRLTLISGNCNELLSNGPTGIRPESQLLYLTLRPNTGGMDGGYMMLTNSRIDYFPQIRV